MICCGACSDSTESEREAGWLGWVQVDGVWVCGQCWSTCDQCGTVIIAEHECLTPFTVISLDNNSGQLLADHVLARDEAAAFASVAHQRHGSVDIQLVAAVSGEHSIAAPSDTGKAAWASDVADCGQEGL